MNCSNLRRVVVCWLAGLFVFASCTPPPTTPITPPPSGSVAKTSKSTSTGLEMVLIVAGMDTSRFPVETVSWYDAV